MVDVDKAHIARLEKEGHVFEILVDTEKALDFKHGKNIPIKEILAVEEVFKDAKKGERAKSLEQVFGTDDIEKIAEIIIKEGEIQLTAEYLRKLKERRRKEVIEMIHQNAINPQTKMPIPYDVIERALEEAKVNINPQKSAESQLDEIVKRLKYVMPIKIEKKRLVLKIPAEYAGKIYNGLHRLAKIEKEDWTSEGNLIATVSVSAGNYGALIETIEKDAHGNIEIKDITE